MLTVIFLSEQLSSLLIPSPSFFEGLEKEEHLMVLSICIQVHLEQKDKSLQWRFKGNECRRIKRRPSKRIEWSWNKIEMNLFQIRKDSVHYNTNSRMWFPSFNTLTSKLLGNVFYLSFFPIMLSYRFHIIQFIIRWESRLISCKIRTNPLPMAEQISLNLLIGLVAFQLASFCQG